MSSGLVNGGKKVGVSIDLTMTIKDELQVPQAFMAFWRHHGVGVMVVDDHGSGVGILRSICSPLWHITAFGFAST